MFGQCCWSIAYSAALTSCRHLAAFNNWCCEHLNVYSGATYSQQDYAACLSCWWNSVVSSFGFTGIYKTSTTCTLSTFLLCIVKKAKVDFYYDTMGCISKCYGAVEIVCFKAVALSFVILRWQTYVKHQCNLM